METYSIHRKAMVAPRKARMTLDLIRGKNIQMALGILNNTNTKSSRLIQKVLDSAIANAVNNFSANEAELYVTKCYINPGPVYKRTKFASRANIDRRDHRTSHITVFVSDKKEV